MLQQPSPLMHVASNTLHLVHTCLQDFIERLPLRAYTDPRLGRGPLNLATCLLPDDNPTDLGPKGYLAYGR
jgi:hypothetical protein